MVTVNESIRDEYLTHASLFERLVKAETARVVEMATDLIEKPVVDKVASTLARLKARGVGTTYQQFKTLRDLDSAIKNRVEKGADAIRARSENALAVIGRAEADFAREAVRMSWPFELQLGSDSISKQGLRSIVKARPFQGKLLREHWKRFDVATRGKIRDQVQIGLVQGESTDDIVRRLVGRGRGKVKTGGVFPGMKRDAETLVRTATSHVSSHAHRESTKRIQEESNILGSDEWTVALDDRLCPQCAALDGRRFRIGEGQFPPIHMRCRCRRVPVTKSFRELGIDLDEPPAFNRAARQYDDLGNALAGTVPGTVDAAAWMNRQPRAIQEQILGGKGAADVFRRGQVPLGRFIDRNANPLTLRELNDLEKQIRAGRSASPVRLAAELR